MQSNHPKNFILGPRLLRAKDLNLKCVENSIGQVTSALLCELCGTSVSSVVMLFLILRKSLGQ
jgi:hypothetical protein